MSKQHTFAKVADILKLTEEEFDRMVPDFLAWFAISKPLEALGAEVQNFIWVDDGKPGEVFAIDIEVKGTSEKTRFEGPAFQEANNG